MPVGEKRIRVPTNFFINQNIGKGGCVLEETEDDKDYRRHYFTGKRRRGSIYSDLEGLYQKLYNRRVQNAKNMLVVSANAAVTVEGARAELTKFRLEHGYDVGAYDEDTANHFQLLESVFDDRLFDKYDSLGLNELYCCKGKLIHQEELLLKETDHGDGDELSRTTKRGYMDLTDDSVAGTDCVFLVDKHYDDLIGREIRCVEVQIARMVIEKKFPEHKCPISQGLMHEVVTIYALDPKSDVPLARHYDRLR